MDKSTLFKCTLCNFSTQYKPNLLRHIQLKHQPFQVFRCDFCNFNATNAIHLNLHKVGCPVNSETTPSTFSYDEEEAPAKEILNAFVKADSNPHIGYINNAKDKPLRLRTHHCSHCDYSTINSKEFLIHRIQAHGEALTIYECEYCSYATDSPGNIKRHTIVHQRYNNPKKTEDGSTYMGELNSMEEMQMQASGLMHMESTSSTMIVPQPQSPVKSLPPPSIPGGSPTNTSTVCLYCKYQAKNRSELMEHNRIHHPDKKLYQCPECKFHTTLKPEYAKHLSEHKNLYKKCKICHFSSPHVSNVIRHMWSHHPEYPVDVDDFADDDMLLNDMEDELLYEDEVVDTEMTQQENACPTCGYKANAKEDMDKHIALVHPEEVGGKTNHLIKRFMDSLPEAAPSPKKKKPNPPPPPPAPSKYKCTYCVFVTSIESEFQEHMAEHSRLNGSCCSICTFTSHDIMAVQKHIDLAKITDPDHQEAEVYIMDNDPYDEEFTTKKKKFKASMEDLTKDKLFLCAHCEFKNVEKRSVISHLGVHANLIPFFCNYCGYSSNWQHTIITHIKTKHGPYVDKHLYHRITYDIDNHQVTLTGVFPDGCPTRGKGATSQENGPFKCNICPYETSRFAYLRKHEQHHKKKPEFKFQCSYCPFYASLANTVQQHELLHASSSSSFSASKKSPQEKKPYKCDQCPYTTQDNQNFLYHKQFHRPNKMANYTCKYCTFWAEDRTHLAHHVGLHASEAQSYTTPAAAAAVVANSEDDSVDVISVDTDFQEAEPAKTDESSSNSTSSRVRINESFKHFKYICLRCPAIFKSISNLDVHTKFHGSNLPYNCSNCDYCAKSLIYLKKHQFVHSAAYAHRRKAVVNYLNHKNEQSPDVTKNEVHYATKSFITYENVSLEQPPELRVQMESRAFDQMLVLEETETKSLIAGNLPRPNQSFKNCKLCPAIFCNQSVYLHHCSLHNSSGKYGCFQCTYATDSKVNLETHLQLHSVKMKRELSKAFHFCPACPAMFLKVSELEEHVKIHPGEILLPPSKPQEAVTQPSAPKRPYLKKRMGLCRNSEKRPSTQRTVVQSLSTRLFGCDLCPFYNDRPERLHTHKPHHKEAAATEGITCYHCNYKIPSDSSLKEHLVIHYQSRSWATPSAFLHYGAVKINMVENGSKDTVFDTAAYKERIEKEKELIEIQSTQINEIVEAMSKEEIEASVTQVQKEKDPLAAQQATEDLQQPEEEGTPEVQIIEDSENLPTATSDIQVIEDSDIQEEEILIIEDSPKPEEEAILEAQDVEDSGEATLDIQIIDDAKVQEEKAPLEAIVIEELQNPEEASLDTQVVINESQEIQEEYPLIDETQGSEDLQELPILQEVQAIDDSQKPKEATLSAQIIEDSQPPEEEVPMDTQDVEEGGTLHIDTTQETPQDIAPHLSHPEVSRNTLAIIQEAISASQATEEPYQLNKQNVQQPPIEKEDSRMSAEDKQETAQSMETTSPQPCTKVLEEESSSPMEIEGEQELQIHIQEDEELPSPEDRESNALLINLPDEDEAMSGEEEGTSIQISEKIEDSPRLIIQGEEGSSSLSNIQEDNPPQMVDEQVTLERAAANEKEVLLQEPIAAGPEEMEVETVTLEADDGNRSEKTTLVVSETLAEVVGQCEDKMEVTVVWDEARQLYKLVGSPFGSEVVLIQGDEDDGLDQVIEIQDGEHQQVYEIAEDGMNYEQTQQVIEIVDDEPEVRPQQLIEEVVDTQQQQLIEEVVDTQQQLIEEVVDTQQQQLIEEVVDTQNQELIEEVVDTQQQLIEEMVDSQNQELIEEVVDTQNQELIEVMVDNQQQQLVEEVVDTQELIEEVVDSQQLVEEVVSTQQEEVIEILDDDDEEEPPAQKDIIRDDEAVVDTLEQLAKIIEENQASNLAEALKKLEERRSTDSKTTDPSTTEEGRPSDDLLSFLTPQPDDHQSESNKGSLEKSERMFTPLVNGGGSHHN